MLSAGSGHTARQNLSALADALTESCGILIVDLCDLVSAELAYLLMSASNGARRSGLNVFSLVFHNENLLYAAVPPNNLILIDLLRNVPQYNQNGRSSSLPRSSKGAGDSCAAGE